MTTTAADPRTATILDAIGETPLIRIDDIWVKLEFLNPSGSVKARIARYMIERAEREGRLRPGDTIVEASSGNTGNAMSMVAAVKGYRMVVVMPEGMSPERLAISRAFGAEVLTVGDFHVTQALETARELGSRPGHFSPQQFDSEWNVDENREWLGPELLRQLPDGVVPDAIVAGVGTGGTLIGVGQAVRAVNPGVAVIGVEPNESCTLMCGEVGKHLIEGISDGFIPGIIERHRDLIDDLVPVDSDASIAEMRRLAREHGLFVGPSSGANLVAARDMARRPSGGARGRDVLLRRGREVHHGLLHARLTATDPAGVGQPGPQGSAGAEAPPEGRRDGCLAARDGVHVPAQGIERPRRGERPGRPPRCGGRSQPVEIDRRAGHPARDGRTCVGSLHGPPPQLMTNQWMNAAAVVVVFR